MTEPLTTAKDIPVKLVLAHANVMLTATLSYSSSEPYAVKAVFHTGLDGPVEWQFGRELLQAGLVETSGLGDVKVIPLETRGFEKLIGLYLNSPFGTANFNMNARLVADFLQSTTDLVPYGDEENHIDIDKGLAALLGEETA